MNRAWVILALVTAACATPPMKLPGGAGASASDGVPALAQARAACAAVRTLTAEVAVSGSVNGRRVRGRLSTGVAVPASARLEAVAPFGPPFFILVARNGRATLLLPRDNRVLEGGRTAEVLEALAGVPLDDEDLRRTLTGCSDEVNADGARAFGDTWRLLRAADGGQVYLRRDSLQTSWRIAAVLGGGAAAWRTDYSDFQHDLPRAVRVTSIGVRRFDLQLVLSQVEIGVPLEADVFDLRVPPDAVPISIDELRRAGPLATQDGR